MEEEREEDLKLHSKRSPRDRHEHEHSPKRHKLLLEQDFSEISEQPLKPSEEAKNCEMLDDQQITKGCSEENESLMDQMDFTSDDVVSKENDTSFSMMSGYEPSVGIEEYERLKEFQVLDEVGDDEGADTDNECSDDSEVGEEEIERMLEEGLPDNFKGPAKEKEKPYITRYKLLIEEKGTNHFEVLPLDWLVVMHNSGIPIYLHKSSRVCTLSKPYFLGKGSVRKHEIPVSAIPCLSYRRALEEEGKRDVINKKIQQLNGEVSDVILAENVCPESKRTNKLSNNVALTKDNANTGEQTEIVANGDTSHIEKQCQDNLPLSSKEDKSMKSEDKIREENDIICNEISKNNEQKNNTSQVAEDSVEQNKSIELNGITKMTDIPSANNELMDTSLSSRQLYDSTDGQVEPTDDYVFKKPFLPDRCQKPSSTDGEEISSQDTQSLRDEPAPVVLPGGLVLPPARVETVQENWKSQHLTHDEVTEYCKRLFKFKNVSFVHFKHWADRRKYTKAKKAMQRPTLPEGTKLISIPAQQPAEEAVPEQGILGRPKRTQREWIMNMNGRSYVSVFHEYVRRALQKQPVYEFRQLENAQTPYEATVLMDGMRYGVGRGGSKRQAKSNAARESLLVLVPEMREQIGREEQSTKINSGEPDLAFFDMVGIEDPRIMGFCTTTMEPSPHAILRTCLLRNFGTGDRHIQTEMKKLKHEKIQFKMSVGKHTATVLCKNKKIGKQRASQAILQALHPHVKSWGSLLRLYGSRSVKSGRDRKLEEQEITLLQDKATVNQPNYAILDKLRQEMERLECRDSAVVSIGTLLVSGDTLPTLSGSSLDTVEM